MLLREKLKANLKAKKGRVSKRQANEGYIKQMVQSKVKLKEQSQKTRKN